MTSTTSAQENINEAGFAVLATVVILAVVLAMIGAIGFQVVVSDSASTVSNVDRQQAVQAARSGISAAYQRIEAESSAKDSPCVLSGTLGSTPNMSSYSVTATYYETITATVASKETCKTLSTGPPPRAVLLKSVGHDRNQTVTMTSEADLAVSSSGSVFGDAAYIGAGFNISHADAFNTSKRTVYVNGNVTCGGGGSTTGTLVVTGTVRLTGSCHIFGKAEAGGTVTIPGGSPTVDTTLISDSSATPGIAITGYPTLHGVVAHTKITYPSWLPGSRPTMKITQDDSSLGSIPTQSFPTVKWTPTGWVAAGYKVVNAGSTCGQAYKAMFAMHTAKTSTGTSKPVALYTACQIKLPGGKTQNGYACYGYPTPYYCNQLVLARNLMVFSAAGFDLPTPFNVVPSPTTASYQLGIIVPTDTAAGTSISCAGGNGNIVMNGQIPAKVDTLFYTPCSISMTGTATVTAGEVYAGEKLTAAGSMSFGTPITIPGATGGSLTLAGKVSVGLVYVRQTG